METLDLLTDVDNSTDKKKRRKKKKSLVAICLFFCVDCNQKI